MDSKPGISNNLYEMPSDVGNLTIQVISFPTYKWVIVTNSHLLKVEGSLQVGMKTPYVTVSLRRMTSRLC